jgi:hypothetical protein
MLTQAGHAKVPTPPTPGAKTSTLSVPRGLAHAYRASPSSSRRTRCSARTRPVGPE